jgi:hypothetical protein
MQSMCVKCLFVHTNRPKTLFFKKKNKIKKIKLFGWSMDKNNQLSRNFHIYILVKISKNIFFNKIYINMIFT